MNYFVEEAIGFMGGIWVLWDDPNSNINIIERQEQLVHFSFDRMGIGKCFFHCNISSPQERERKQMWDSIQNIAHNLAEPWILMGDFNYIVDQKEKRGGGLCNIHNCRRFRKWIDDCKLLDLGYVGQRFTWKGGVRGDLDRVFKRLDRALGNVQWRTLFPDVRIEVLPCLHSDHHPLIVRFIPDRMDRGNKPFRFEAM
ncbi:Endonuclease/exonuclease/phosphatase family protein [Arachis hypogaea]|nr:Endonuclease/exonuclease/phosphatase family protein [Arachis hypogaea]